MIIFLIINSRLLELKRIEIWSLKECIMSTKRVLERNFNGFTNEFHYFYARRQALEIIIFLYDVSRHLEEVKN
jgi:hypothetical protein